MVRAIARRYEEEGLGSALQESPRPGGQRALDVKQSQRIIAMVCTSPPEGRARWSVRLMAEQVVKRKLVSQVARETIPILLQSHDLKPWREKSWCIAELDEQYIERMEDVLALYEKPLSEEEGRARWSVRLMAEQAVKRKLVPQRIRWFLWMRNRRCCT